MQCSRTELCCLKLHSTTTLNTLHMYNPQTTCSRHSFFPLRTTISPLAGVVGLVRPGGLFLIRWIRPQEWNKREGRVPCLEKVSRPPLLSTPTLFPGWKYPSLTEPVQLFSAFLGREDLRLGVIECCFVCVCVCVFKSELGCCSVKITGSWYCDALRMRMCNPPSLIN